MQNSAHGRNCVSEKRQPTKKSSWTENKTWRKAYSCVCSIHTHTLTQKCGIFVRLFGPSFFLLFISISFATWIYDYFYGEISTLFLTVASERASERVGLIIIKIPWLVYHTIWFDVFIRFHVLVSFILCYFRFFVCLFCCCWCCVFGAVIPHCNVRVLFLRHFKLVFHQLYGVFLCLCVVLGSILTSQTKNGSGECYFSVFGVAEID